MKTIYQEKGYVNRRAYLESVSEDYGMSLEHVLLTADLLGPSEDFDGLINTIEDWVEQ